MNISPGSDLVTSIAADFRADAVRKATSAFPFLPNHSVEELKPWRQLVHSFNVNWSAHQGEEPVTLVIYGEDDVNTRIIPERPYRGHGPILLNGGSPLVSRTSWYVEVDLIGKQQVEKYILSFFPP